VAKDEVQAVDWFRRAAEQGDAAAQTNLGQAYREGRGVSKDQAEAVAWFRRAAEQGSGWAQYFLGNAYRTGEGVGRDDAQAVMWWHKGADQGYAFAENNLGAMYALGEGVARDYGRAAYWLASATRHGHPTSAAHLKKLLGKLPARRLRAATEVRDAPDAAAAAIRMGVARERAYELSRIGVWIEAYFPEGHLVGYVSADALTR
jgi:TPR repeat protein